MFTMPGNQPKHQNHPWSTPLNSRGVLAMPNAQLVAPESRRQMLLPRAKAARLTCALRLAFRGGGNGRKHGRNQPKIMVSWGNMDLSFETGAFFQ